MKVQLTGQSKRNDISTKRLAQCNCLAFQVEKLLIGEIANRAVKPTISVCEEFLLLFDHFLQIQNIRRN